MKFYTHLFAIKSSMTGNNKKKVSNKYQEEISQYISQRVFSISSTL